VHCRRASLFAAALLAATLASPASGQLGLEANFKGYTFDDGLGPAAAQLLVFPVALRLPMSNSFQVDFFSAWARGEVERENATYRLEGWVDTQAKMSWTAAPWMVLSVGVNIPTGRASHDAEESAVAAVLAADLLGFREATWGTGLSITSGLATAARLGGWGVGIGASYRVANGFEPAAGQAVTYEPGNEARFRLGLDHNVGEAGKFSAGVTLQNFAEDQVRDEDADPRNLFQAGDRLMVDASYAFRLGSQTWTLYGSDLWREKGDLFLPVVDARGTVVGDSTVATGTQNLISAGLAGAIPLGSVYRVRPTVDVRLQSRAEQNGSNEGSGWMVAAGGDIPLRFGNAFDMFPRARYTFGSIEGTDGKMYGTSGAEFGVTIRFGG
jgi:hypothetical protein